MGQGKAVRLRTEEAAALNHAAAKAPPAAAR
jgi:hypothetical protein